MTAHLHSTFDPGCYRCDLGRDEEIAGMAEEYWEENLEPALVASGMGKEGLRFLRLKYVSDIRLNEKAVAELSEWATARMEAL